MKASIKDIVEIIPDFEDLSKLVGEIGELSFKKMQLENKIKELESKTFREAMKQPLENGKLPSSSFVTNAYIHTGLNGEIVELREKFADVSATLEKRKLLMSIYRDMMEMFRTVSANERNANGF